MSAFPFSPNSALFFWAHLVLSIAKNLVSFLLGIVCSILMRFWLPFSTSTSKSLMSNTLGMVGIGIFVHAVQMWDKHRKVAQTSHRAAEEIWKDAMRRHRNDLD